MEALLIVSEKTLRVLNITYNMFNFENNPDIILPVITGAIGTSFSESMLCSIVLEELFTNFSVIQTVSDVQDDISKVPETTEEDIQMISTDNFRLNSEDGPFSVVSYPRILPKLVGVNVVEGHMNSSEVIDSLNDHKDIDSAWSMAHLVYAMIPS